MSEMIIAGICGGISALIIRHYRKKARNNK